MLSLYVLLILYQWYYFSVFCVNEMEMTCGEEVLGVLTASCQARSAHSDKAAVSSQTGVCLVQAGHPTALHSLPLITFARAKVTQRRRNSIANINKSILIVGRYC